MKKVLIVAPHADDETLGCGGTILRYIESGYDVHWLLVTGMSVEAGFTNEQVKERIKEIVKVKSLYGFSSVHELYFPPAALETLTKGRLIAAVSKVIQTIQPNEVFTVYRNDAHSDHEIVYDAVMSATKSFRYPFIKRVLAYETISETDFGLKPEDGGFKPNVFIDITSHLEKKLEILEVFKSEIGEFPFPRSRKALESLACIRGVQSNCHAAEAFMLIKEII
ncbi:PIG-L deacetylase family protein [Psychromonas aquimarina]|uniref:PIG-L deacetylase family protein n=1 Tax=Psychromonas aquimarina TaxID=444919 RepID=UPI000409A395|nr:PIG-L deacetylase family protein [Psychromonas aquimarina]